MAESDTRDPAIGTLLRAARTAAGLKQRDLAEHYTARGYGAMDQTRVSRIETGTEPRVFEFMRLLHLLGLGEKELCDVHRKAVQVSGPRATFTRNEAVCRDELRQAKEALRTGRRLFDVLRHLRAALVNSGGVPGAPPATGLEADVCEFMGLIRTRSSASSNHLLMSVERYWRHQDEQPATARVQSHIALALSSDPAHDGESIAWAHCALRQRRPAPVDLARAHLALARAHDHNSLHKGTSSQPSGNLRGEHLEDCGHALAQADSEDPETQFVDALYQCLLARHRAESQGHDAHVEREALTTRMASHPGVDDPWVDVTLGLTYARLVPADIGDGQLEALQKRATDAHLYELANEISRFIQSLSDG